MKADTVLAVLLAELLGLEGSDEVNVDTALAVLLVEILGLEGSDEVTVDTALAASWSSSRA